MAEPAADMWLVIPVKPFDEGKARLAAVLAPAERRALNRGFFDHTLRTGLAVFRPARTLVVSRSQEALAAAEKAGCRGLAEAGDGDLNDALAQAAAWLAGVQAGAALVLSCDLPTVSPADVQAMIEAAGPGRAVAIACDRDEEGTNALLVSPPAIIAYRYGAASLKAHSEEARRQGVEPAIVRRPGLAFDVDTPEHLELFRQRRLTV